MTDPQIATRRRGTALEDAILDATWIELETGGYSSFTFKAVADRAGTSRPVLYRRWATRASLASAAIVRHVKLHPLSVPDLGDLRDELCMLLRQFADRSPPRLLRLIFEMSEDMAAEGASFMDSRFQEFPLQEILDRALQRGEIDEGQLKPRVVRLPLTPGDPGLQYTDGWPRDHNDVRRHRRQHPPAAFRSRPAEG